MPSEVLSATLPTKPSQTVTSQWPLKRSRPSTLPMKLIPEQRAEERQGVVGEGVALGVFFADGEQADARVGDVQDIAGVHVAHDGELNEIVGIAVDVGADIEQKRWGAA